MRGMNNNTKLSSTAIMDANEDDVNVSVDNHNLSDDIAMDTVINRNSKRARASGGRSATTFLWQYFTDTMGPTRVKC